MEPTYRDLIDATDALFDAKTLPRPDEEAELRAAVDRLLDHHRSMADPHDIDNIRMNAKLL